LPRDRPLFVAHREEILEQSRATFAHALRDASFGEFWGPETSTASIRLPSRGTANSEKILARIAGVWHNAEQFTVRRHHP
jgi:superfamily II DNA or RNA helicase